MNRIVIDMGGTRLKIGFFRYEKLERQVVLSARSGENFTCTIDMINSEIRKLKETCGISSIDGIGLSTPGIVDTKENRIIAINEKYGDSIAFDLNSWAKNVWNAPLVTENDARAALVGEWQQGAGKGINNIVTITLGTGVGGAALIGGKLLHGKHFQAGCLGGHFCIDFQGKGCNCGNRGCVETQGSSWVLPALATAENYPVEGINFEKLFNDMRAGNPAAIRILRTCINAWSACAVNMIHAYDPEMVILGGGVMKSADIVLPEIQSYIERYAWTPWGKVAVAAAALEDTAALHGMYYLLVKQTT